MNADGTPCKDAISTFKNSLAAKKISYLEKTIEELQSVDFSRHVQNIISSLEMKKRVNWVNDKVQNLTSDRIISSSNFPATFNDRYPQIGAQPSFFYSDHLTCDVPVAQLCGKLSDVL